MIRHRSAWVCVLLVITLPACTSRESSRDGPLRADSAAGGGISVVAPKRFGASWRATFGNTLRVSQGTVATLRSVSYSTQVWPVGIDTVVREVEQPENRRDRRDPVGSMKGSPDKLPGRFLPALGGVRVDVPCRDLSRFIEILTTVTVDRGGAVIDGTIIHYQVDGKPYESVGHWKYVVCDAQGHLNHCRPAGT